MNEQRKITGIAVSLSIGLAAALCASSAAAEPDRPTVYSGPELEQESTISSIRDAFSDRFAIAAAPADGEFVPARLTKWTYHPYIREVGRVTIAAVADVDGRMRDPVVIESTNPRLNRMFRETVKYWVCEPARFNGKAVPTVTTRTVEVRWRAPVRMY